MADRIHPLTRFRLDTDGLERNLKHASDRFPHRPLMRRELGALGGDDAVNIDQAEARVSDALVGLPKHFGGVAIAVGLIRIRVKLADVRQARGAQQGVSHGVQQGVGVAMPDQMPVVRHVDAS